MIDIVDEIIKYPMQRVQHLANLNEIRILLENLEKTIDLEGDIVELGCFKGGSTIYFQKYLNRINSNKFIHVYDSFKGLPKSGYSDAFLDENSNIVVPIEGLACTTSESLVENFNYMRLKLPIINEGWFSEIPDEKYPDKICFAFFDSDLYSSIMDSFNKVYHKVVLGGKIIVHDFTHPIWPGVKKACEEFLKDKSVKIEENDANDYPGGTMAIITKV